MNQKVSIIIPAYDHPDLLNLCLNSIFENTNYKNFEILVSANRCEGSSNINNSDINNRISNICNNFFEKFPKNFKFILNAINLKFGPGVMAIFPFASGEFICTFNDDTIIPQNSRDWLDKLINVFSSNKNIASVTPCLLHKNRTIYWIGKQNPLNKFHDYLHYEEFDARLPKRMITSCYNNMACCLIPRYLVEEFSIGRRNPHYGSDSDFCSDVLQKYKDMKHVVLPEVKIFHYNIYNERIK
jgi:GT2 family glycosyltransferase